MANTPLSVRAYLAATHLVPLLAKPLLRKRLKRGKEDPKRWTEKRGHPSAARPKGQLIWLHAVGLGEVLSLRGLIDAMAPLTQANFLITSGTLAGAQVLSKNTPARTIHQFLPLDAPSYRQAFLDHWQPDLCIWAEQDIWPGFVADLSRRGIPQALVAARMNAQSLRRRRKVAAQHRWMFQQMALITAQDSNTKSHIEALGADNVRVTGSLKPAAPPLGYDQEEMQRLQSQLQDRFVWITAPSHPADETIALKAHEILLQSRTDALLIIAPRFPDRHFTLNKPMAVRSANETIKATDQVYLADTFGDLGLLYRLSQAAFIGGTNDATQGHSPWEAAALQTAILHGPNIENFRPDFSALHTGGAATEVATPDALAKALNGDLRKQIAAADQVVTEQKNQTLTLARDLVAQL